MALDNIAVPPLDGLPETFSRWVTQFREYIVDQPFVAGLNIQAKGGQGGFLNVKGQDGVTPTSGAAITSNVYYAWNGSAQVANATITIRSTEAWGVGANGTRFQIRVIPTGTATLAEIVSIEGGGLFVTRSTAGLGYGTGAGGAVAQATSKATGVTLSKACGAITMNNAALASGAKVSFVVTNTAVAATDGVTVWVASGGTANAYRADVTAVAAGSFTVTVENITAGSLSEAPIIGFALVKAVTS